MAKKRKRWLWASLAKTEAKKQRRAKARRAKARKKKKKKSVNWRPPLKEGATVILRDPGSKKVLPGQYNGRRGVALGYCYTNPSHIIRRDRLRGWQYCVHVKLDGVRHHHYIPRRFLEDAPEISELKQVSDYYAVITGDLDEILNAP